MSSSTASFFPTVASSAVTPVPSNSKQITLTSKQIAIVIGLVVLGLLILLSPIFVIAIRRFLHKKKIEQPEDDIDSKSVESQEESFASKPSKHSLFKHAEADPFIEYLLKNPHPSSRPTSSVKNYFTGLGTHEAHVVSLDYAQSPKDNDGFETIALNSAPPPTSPVRDYSRGGLATHETHVVSFDVAQQSPKANEGFGTVALHSYRPNASKSTIKLAPLIIPQNIPMSSNGEHSAKGTITRKPSDSGLSEDSASLYSVPSESASTYLSRSSSLATIKPPPVPPIPVHFTSPTLSTFSRRSDVTVTPPRPYDEEESISRLLPPLPSFPRLTINGEDDRETEIYNVAKLLQTRQAKLSREQKDSISRNASKVSHIERSGSISAVISPTDEESYRPRYYRLKQKRDITKVPFPSNLSPSDSLSTPNPLVSPQLGPSS